MNYRHSLSNSERSLLRIVTSGKKFRMKLQLSNVNMNRIVMNSLIIMADFNNLSLENSKTIFYLAVLLQTNHKHLWE